MMSLYLDNNASTPLLPAAWEAMRPYFLQRAGNPASSHQAGRQARQALEDARESIAGLLDARPDEVFFTSGATEANNLALFGLVLPGPGVIVSSALEHPCVTEPIAQLVGQGYTSRHLPVTSEGKIDLAQATFPERTSLASVMLANHETGAVQPVAELAERLAGRAPLHCDAAAAGGKLPLSFRRLGVTALSLSAHKFHGPKGVGALLLRRDARLRPLFFGGHQQAGKRPGTEPVPLAVGMAVALAWCIGHLEEHQAQARAQRDRFLAHLRAHAAPLVVNGPAQDGLPHALNVSFPGCRGDALLMRLDLAGVACSTGSACSSGSLLPSPVLSAMGTPAELLNSALRFSFSSFLSDDDIDEAARRIAACVNKLRQAEMNAV